MDEYEPFAAFRVPVENTMNDKKECDRRKISETNVLSDDRVTSETLIGDALKGSPHENNGETNSVSDGNRMASKRRERKILRRCKMWRREHIDDIERELAVQKSKKKMIVPGTVVEKIETSEFDLANAMEETVNAFEGRCLVLADRDCKNESCDAKINRDILLEVSDQLDTINGSFTEIADQWEENSKKEDLLVVCDDFVGFKTRTHGFLEQKDAVIEKLVGRLEELNLKLEKQIENNSDELVLLNEFAENNIRSAAEVHDKHFAIIAELIDNEMTKKTNTDSARWKALVDSTITEIISEGSKRLETIEKNDIELIRRHETQEDEILQLKVSETEKNIGVETDLGLIKLKYAQKVEEYRYSCHDLQNRIDHSHFRLDSQRNQIALLQERKNDLKKKHKKIVPDYQIQVPSIEKQIANTISSIEKNTAMIRTVEERNCANYMKMWNIDEDRITTNVKNLLLLDCAIHEYLGAGRTLSSWETPAAGSDCTTPLTRPVDGLVFCDRGAENSDSPSYERARDKALDRLLLDFVERNSGFMFDGDLNEMFDAADPTRRPSCAYGALAAWRLDDEHGWNLLKSEFKPFVTCAVCRTEVNWKSNRTDDADLTACDRWKEMNSGQTTLFEKLSNHVTRHNENIDKVVGPDSMESDDHTTGGLLNVDGTENVCDEERQRDAGYDDVSEDGHEHSLDSSSSSSSSSRCANAEHELFADDERFRPVMTTVIGARRTAGRPCGPPGQRDDRDERARWELTGDDLARYWSRFARPLPADSVRLWDASRDPLGRHVNALRDHKRKRLRLTELRNENDKLKEELCMGTEQNRFTASE